MTNVLTETFETTPGYDNIWSETKGAASIIDPDYDTSNIGSPAGWGSECLHINISVVTQNAITVHTLASSTLDIFTRVYFRINQATIDDLTINSGSTLGILAVYDNSDTFRAGVTAVHDGADVILRLSYMDDGGHQTDGGLVIVANTEYCIEMKYKQTANEWEWKVDSNSQGSGSATLLENIQKIRIGGCSLGDITLFADLIRADDSDWIGLYNTTNRQKVDGYGFLVNGGLRS